MQMEGTAPELGLMTRDITTLRYGGHLETIDYGRPKRYRLTLAEPRDIADGIRAYRLERRMTKKDICARAGLKHDSLIHYEAGTSIPMPASLYFVLRVLGVRFADFFARIDGEILRPRPLRHIGRMDVESAIRDVLVTLGLPADNSQPRLTTLRTRCQAHGVNWIDFWREVDARLPQ
jgi:transcriptional regulator with XRE-family HTH domain